MPKNNPRITRQWLEKTYEYDPEWGRFRVTQKTATKLRVGELAGWFHKRTNRWYLSLQGAPVSMAIAVWVWHTGEYPPRHVYPINGNPIDTRIENLALRGDILALREPRVSSEQMTDEELQGVFRYTPLTGELQRFQPRSQGWRTLKPDSVVTLPKAYNGTRAKVPPTHLIWFLQEGVWLPSGRLIDHINGNRLDNRWENLRETDSQGNRVNRFETRAGGVTGACKRGHRGWVGRIKTAGRVLTSTPVYFTTPELAHEWFKQRHRELHGELSAWVCRPSGQQKPAFRP